MCTWDGVECSGATVVALSLAFSLGFSRFFSFSHVFPPENAFFAFFSGGALSVQLGRRGGLRGNGGRAQGSSFSSAWRICHADKLGVPAFHRWHGLTPTILSIKSKSTKSGGALSVHLGRGGVLRSNGGRALARRQQPPGRRPLGGRARAQVVQQRAP